MKKMKLCALFSAMFLTACVQNTTALPPSVTEPGAEETQLSVVQAIPSPSSMTADVTTHGRVSTVKQVDVVYVGKQIPFTFSEGKVANSVDFEWYVSKHFALKTDYPAKKAKFFLELLELSYPYYVDLFGMEPANIGQQRIASTYATSNEVLRDAMFDDGFNRGIHHSAGGEAMYYNWVGYSFPTERPQHQRYISIHETMHSYQMALGNYPWTPSWHGEGLGDATANHIFNSEKKQLAVFGHDVPVFDMLTWGLDTYKKEQPSLVDIHNRKWFDRGLNVLFVQFMYNNPEYSQYMKVYHQEVMRRQTNSRSESLAILQEIVPNWTQMEAEFKAWVENIQDTHQLASRGPWEIDGNMFYKRKSSYDYKPQRAGFNLTPGQAPTYRPFMLDFPAADASDLVLKAQRGVEAPTLGYELSYQKETLDNGKIGMAFGVKLTADNAKAIEKKYRGWKGANTDLDEQLRIEVQSAKSLVIDARNFGGTLHDYALPLDVRNSLESQEQPKLGVSVQMTKNSVIVTVKTKNAQPFLTTFPITAKQYSDLTNRTFGLVSSDNQHGITPYIDDGRDLNPSQPDYAVDTAANAWGFKGDKLAQRFARANWKAGDSTPQSWKEAFQQLNQAALNPDKSNAIVASINGQMTTLANDGSGLNSALAELSGVQLQMDWLGASLDKMREYAIITNHGAHNLNAHVQFNVNGETSERFTVDIKSGERGEIRIPADLLSAGKTVKTTLDYQWLGQELTQTMEQKTKQYRGYELTEIAANFADGSLKLDANLHGPFAGETSGEVTFDLYHGSHKLSHSEKITLQPYEERLLTHSFKVTEKDLEHSAWYEITIVADVDGEPVTLRKRAPYTPAKFNRK